MADDSLAEIKFQDMSDEQILYRIICDTMEQYFDFIELNGGFNQQRAVERILGHLRDLFNESRGIGYYDRIMTHDLTEREAMVERLTPLVNQRVSDMALEHSKEWMESEIQKAKAKAILPPIFEAAGFKKANIHYNDGSAQVMVRLPGKYMASFYVDYSELKKDSCLDELIGSLNELKIIVPRFVGRRFTINHR